MKKRGLLFVSLTALLLLFAITLGACVEQKPKPQYTIYFESNGGSEVAAVTVSEGESFNLPSPTRDGFVFDGWFDNAALSGESLSSPYTPTAVVTLFAKWKVDNGSLDPAGQFLISFDTNGGIAIETMPVEKGGSIELPTPVREGFIFDGWFDNPNLFGEKVSSPFFPDENVVLFAKWIEGEVPQPADQYTISFDSNGGDEVQSITARAGTPIELPVPTHKDHTDFIAWFTDREFTREFVATVMPAENLTLYAKWAFLLYQYDKESDSYTVYSKDNPPHDLTEIIIPATREGKPVKKIAPGTFSLGSSLKTVTMPNSITHIGANAFYGCGSLSDLVLSSNLTVIETHAFYGCASLTDMPLPSGLTSIGERAFSDCTGLTEISVPGSVTAMGFAVFENCANLNEITLPFLGKEEGAADDGHLGYSFGAVTSALNGNHVPDSLKTVTITNADSIQIHAFADCQSIENISLPESVSFIGMFSFSKCKSLKNINIPSNVTVISDGIFSGCSALENIELPAGVTHIGWEAFSGCSTLANVEIPDGVTRIGAGAFSGCSSFTCATVPSGVTFIGNNAFTGCNGLSSISLPLIGERADVDFRLHDIFGNDHTYVPDSLKSVVITGGKSIASAAFFNCSSLTNIELPQSIEYIGTQAFSNCNLLTEIIIPHGVKTISGSAFQGCTSLTGVIVPDSVPLWDTARLKAAAH